MSIAGYEIAGYEIGPGLDAPDPQEASRLVRSEVLTGARRVWAVLEVVQTWRMKPPRCAGSGTPQVRSRFISLSRMASRPLQS